MSEVLAVWITILSLILAQKLLLMWGRGGESRKTAMPFIIYTMPMLVLWLVIMWEMVLS